MTEKKKSAPKRKTRKKATPRKQTRANLDAQPRGYVKKEAPEETPSQVVPAPEESAVEPADLGSKMRSEEYSNFWDDQPVSFWTKMKRAMKKAIGQ